MRNKLMVTAATLVLMVVVSLAVSASAGGSYTLTLNGGESAGKIDGSVSLSGRSMGDLPGVFDLTIQYDPASKDVLGGRWSLTVIDKDSAGKDTYKGSLTGKVSGGKVTVGDDSISVDSAQLSVEAGAGSFAAARDGKGSLVGTLDPKNAPSFAGTLSLQF